MQQANAALYGFEQEVLTCAGPAAHMVQLYESDDRLLVRNAGRYFAEGFGRGDRGLIVTTEERAEAFRREFGRLGIDAAAAVRDERLTFFDSHQTLARILVDGYPDAARFDEVVGAAVRRLVASNESGALRAYGDMVGTLWTARQFPSAIRLEQLWGKLLAQVPFSLFCAYSIDLFGTDFEAGVVDALLCAHSHFLPAGSNATLQSALGRAMEDVLGAKVASLPAVKLERRPAWPELPRAESLILWLKKNLRDQAGDIFVRARQYYQETA